MDACAYGIGSTVGTSGEVERRKSLLDPRLQWKRACNIWYNAQLRTLLYSPIALLQWIGTRVMSKS